jgi:hypothetical protein
LSVDRYNKASRLQASSGATCSKVLFEKRFYYRTASTTVALERSEDQLALESLRLTLWSLSCFLFSVQYMFNSLASLLHGLEFGQRGKPRDNFRLDTQTSIDFLTAIPSHFIFGIKLTRHVISASRQAVHQIERSQRLVGNPFIQVGSHRSQSRGKKRKVSSFITTLHLT